MAVAVMADGNNHLRLMWVSVWHSKNAHYGQNQLDCWCLYINISVSLLGICYSCGFILSPAYGTIVWQSTTITKCLPATKWCGSFNLHVFFSLSHFLSFSCFSAAKVCCLRTLFHVTAAWCVQWVKFGFDFNVWFVRKEQQQCRGK